MPDLLDDILPYMITADSEAEAAHEVVRLVPGLQPPIRDEHGTLVIGVETLLGFIGSRSPNGAVGYEVACFGCGKKFHAKRRPIPSKHNWCEECKANGEPATQRARDYRDRKREERTR